MAFSKNMNAVALTACCLAFGLYWGSSYVGFSNALLDLQLTAFVEVLTRGAFCILFALVLNKMKRIPIPLFVAMLVLQVCVVAAKTIGVPTSSILFSLVISVSYSLYSGFLIVCSAYCLYAFSSHRSLYCIVPIGFIISYAYGMLAITLDAQPIVNAVAGIAVPLILFFPMKQKRLLTNTTSPTQLGADSLVSEIRTWLKRRSDNAPSVYFLGAIALFLVLIGVWFRIGANVEGALWLLNPLVGGWCIFALAAVLIIMAVTNGNVSIRVFSAGTLGTFLGVLALTAFFWDEAVDFIKGFSSIWLVTFQSLLYISCRSFGRTSFDHAVGLGVFQGAALVMLAIGNVVELFFFENLPFDRISFLTFSFVFLFAFAIATIAEFYPLVKKTSEANRTATHGAAALNTQSENDSGTALRYLCEQFGVTAREQDIIGRYSRGRSIASIADDLVLSKDTVKTHVKRAYVKLDVHSRRELQDAIEAEEIRLQSKRPR